MKSTVQEFAAILTDRMEQLKSMLNYYVQAGFPSDIAQTYEENYYSPDNQIISELSNRMNSEHVAFLDNVIEDLISAGGRH